ncbi:MAG: sigma-70 family RNA polymerase sigma factor [Xanthomonadales bacterium]|nr:sigma-70 family RNA polymerase sigma factor [Xanthomonadales bacterium]
MSADVTQLLSDWRGGDAGARDRLIEVLYPELRRLAGNLFRAERANHTLQPTALVNEAWLRLAGSRQLAAEHRPQLFALAARVMREILVDHARSRGRLKRDGGERVTLSGLESADAAPAQPDLLDLDAALARLEGIDPGKARIVELRYFGGLAIDEIAAAVDASPATVKRHWEAARMWLFHALSEPVSANAP